MHVALLLLLACGTKRLAPEPANAPPPAVSVTPPPAVAPLPQPGGVAPKANEIAVEITDVSGGTTSVELTCNSGHRDRQAVEPDAASIGGTVWFRGVATDSCTLWFKGGQPARFGPVRGGSAWQCRLVETTAVCDPM